MRRLFPLLAFASILSMGGLALAAEAPLDPDAARRCDASPANAAVCNQAQGRILDLLAHNWTGFAARTTGATCLHIESNGTPRPCDAPEGSPDYTKSFVYAMRACGDQGYTDPRIAHPGFVMPRDGGFSFTYHGFNRGQALIDEVRDDQGVLLGWRLQVGYSNILNRCTVVPANTPVPTGNPFFDTTGTLLIPGASVPEPQWRMEVPRRRKPAVADQFWAVNPEDPSRPLLRTHRAVVSPQAPEISFSELFPPRH